MSRLTLALHLSQESLPPSGAHNQQQRVGLPPSAVPGSGSGYGPPLTATALSHLISSTLYNPPTEPTPTEAEQGITGQPASRTEYDLVCLPLTNQNWAQRWERMCTFTQSATEAELGVVPQDGSDSQQRQEAEMWRAGGAFTRNEVNLTRSGQSHPSVCSCELLLIIVARRGSWQFARNGCGLARVGLASRGNKVRLGTREQNILLPHHLAGLHLREGRAVLRVIG